ncbi:Kinesin-like protein 2 [Zancudomyces culisetae]|nr:Kinesin-like protein 2 [Zancudomyces culisetae]|eukprot:OMH81773.1 Kinesin-like protein 2 [Zancudomyces culisetae]
MMQRFEFLENEVAEYKKKLDEAISEKAKYLSLVEEKMLEAKINDEKYKRECENRRQLEESLQKQREKHEKDMQENVIMLKEVKVRHEEEVESLEVQVKKLQRASKEQAEEIENYSEQVRKSKRKFDELEDEFSQSRDKIKKFKQRVETLQDEMNEKEQKISELQAVLDQIQEKKDKLEETLRKEERLRRRLHNTVQELKGNIRVFCRARPAPSQEKADICIQFSDNNGEKNGVEVCTKRKSAMGKDLAETTQFKFDQVFDTNSTQEEVYQEIEQLVQSALDGYSVCIFAYGQTGSGKTYTMEGNAENSGVIPRALQQIYNETVRLEPKGWKYELKAQFLEIYNEQIYDLLTNKSKENKLDIKQAQDGSIYVADCEKASVTSIDMVNTLLRKAAKNRSVASTLCNDRSSRSHSVFSLYISGTNSKTSESCNSVLNLVDLAGSERLTQSGAVGDRLKETQSINKSLSCLGDVIASIASKDKHIPYRNSKLTYLLMPSLGAGSSKTLMFVCVNPLTDSSQETLCSLRFASKVNSCHIGSAVQKK